MCFHALGHYRLSAIFYKHTFQSVRTGFESIKLQAAAASYHTRSVTDSTSILNLACVHSMKIGISENLRFV